MLSNTDSLNLLDKNFYIKDTKEVARELLGKMLVRKVESHILTGLIVETEAYLGENDPAAHASFGKTKRTEVLYGPGGFAYVYQLRHHFLLNISVEESGSPGCVLIRSLEPVMGIDRMMKYRNVEKVENLTNGPAKLCQAMQIDLENYGDDLCDTESGLFITEGVDFPGTDIVIGKRVGISKARDLPLRYATKDNPYVSVKMKKDV